METLERRRIIENAANGLRKCRERLISRLKYRNSPTAKARNAICARRYHQRHPERVRLAQSRSHRKNREKRNAYHRLMRKTNPQFLISERLRARIGNVLRRKGGIKQKSTVELLGCSFGFFKTWIESQFEPWMNWGNTSEWHIEHIVPLGAFDLSDPEELKWSCFYKNLMPLGKRSNQLKSDMLPQSPPPWMPTHVANRIYAGSL